MTEVICGRLPAPWEDFVIGDKLYSIYTVESDRESWEDPTRGESINLETGEVTLDVPEITEPLAREWLSLFTCIPANDFVFHCNNSIAI